MFCPNCGNEAPNAAVFCPTCGLNMQDYFRDDNVSKDQQDDKINDGLTVNRSEKHQDAEHKEEPWQAFVDTRYHFYDQKWSVASQPDVNAGWNWASFFVGLFWLGYRKMYRELLILIGVFFLIDFVAAVTSLFFLSTLLPLVLYFYLGMKGNALYYRHVRQKLAEFQHDDLSQADYRERGGVSGTGVVVAIILLLSYAGLSTIIFGF